MYIVHEKHYVQYSKIWQEKVIPRRRIRYIQVLYCTYLLEPCEVKIQQKKNTKRRKIARSLPLIVLDET